MRPVVSTQIGFRLGRHMPSFACSDPHPLRSVPSMLVENVQACSFRYTEGCLTQGEIEEKEWRTGNRTPSIDMGTSDNGDVSAD
jgi:hypothetical protein